MTEPIIIKTVLVKEISCYENEKLPLHTGCPYNKVRIDERCALCVRRKEKILTIKSNVVGDEE